MKKMCVVLLVSLVMGVGWASASEDEYGPGHMMMEDYGYGMMGSDRAMMGSGRAGGGMMMGRGYSNQGWGACSPMMGGAMMHQGWRQGGMPMMGRGYMGHGGGMMMGRAMMGLSPEQYQELMNDTVKLRKKMHMLHFEHMEAARKPKTTLEELGNMEQEMLDLRKDMMKKIDQYRAQK